MSDGTLAVKVLPNAPRNVIVGWQEQHVLKVKVHAPALEGRANEELCEFIAEVLGLPKRNVFLTHGHKSRQKLLRLVGITSNDAKTRIDSRLSGGPVSGPP